MRQRRLLKITGPLLVGALALTACGSESSNSGSSGSSGTKKVAKIGVIAPLSGELSALGLGIKNSVDLAIKQANEANAVPGYTLELDAQDDQAKPDVGAQAATKLASDAEVVGVVGTLNSSVAQQVQPILDKANIVMISPANTNPTLTQGDNPASPVRAYKNYFRTATTDAVQGPFAAQYLYTSGITKVVVVHDKKTYGQGLSAAFAAEFTKEGGTILATETVNPGDKDFSAVISKIKPLAPQAVYYGGEFPEASLLSNQLKAKGVTVALMGGDGIYSGKYIENGKAATEGDLATSVGAPTESLDSAKAFVAAYAAGGYTEPYEAYGAYAFDAATAIIDALKKSLAQNKDGVSEAAREETVKEVQDITFEGVTGPVSFDQYGDTTSKVLTVYKVSGGKWVPEKTDTFK